MNLRLPLIIILLFLFTGLVSADWSIADPSVPGNAAYIKSIEGQGYWNFEWDPTNPISAAMYCCWWEMVYGNQKKYFDAINGETSDGSNTPSGTSIETKSYCPVCHVDDSFATLEVEPDLQVLSDELMETKPWLKEGKKANTELTVNNTTTNKVIMSFSDPVKI